MRYLYISLLALLAFSSCKKDVTYNCAINPTIILAPDGYTYADWDTIEIRAYDASGNQINDSVAFYPKNLEDIVTINPNFEFNPNVSITIPATGDVHWLKNVFLHQATVVAKEDRGIPVCTNDVSYELNGVAKSYNGESVVKETLKKP